MPLDNESAISTSASAYRTQVLAEKLREFIKRSGKTQRQVADEAGIPQPSYLSHMVNGRINWVESNYFPELSTALGLNLREIEELRPDAVTKMMAAAAESASYYASAKDKNRQVPVLGIKENVEFLSNGAIAVAGTALLPVFDLNQPDEALDHIHASIPRSEYKSNLKVYEINDDSFLDSESKRGYQYGDLAYASMLKPDMRIKPELGTVYLLIHKGKYYFRRYVKISNTDEYFLAYNGDFFQSKMFKINEVEIVGVLEKLQTIPRAPEKW